MKDQIVGREKELKWLTDSVDTMLTGKPAFRFLEGTVGIGKTALLELTQEYFAQKAPADKCAASYQCIVSHNTNDNLKAWASITTQLIMSERPIVPEKQGFFKRITENNRKSIEVVSEIMGVIPGVDLAAAAIKICMALKDDKDKPEDVENKFNRFTESPAEFYSDLVVSYAQKKPTLIVLDDIQWIDPASVSILSAILIKIVNGKLKPMLCVLGAYRTAESSSQSAGLVSLDSFVNTIAKRYAKPDFVRVQPLSLLNKSDLAKIIEAELDKACALKEYEIQWIADKSMGTPYMTKRIVEILKDNGVIKMDSGKYEFSDELVFDGSKYDYRGNLLALIRTGVFESYENSFAEGLSSLTPDEITTLKYASVQGLNFESKALAATLGITEEDVLERLYLLTRKTLISSQSEGHFGFATQRVFSFQTDAFCRVVNKQLFEPQKKIVAHKLAIWFESEFDSKLLILLQNLDCPNTSDFAQESEIVQEKTLEQFASSAAAYYALAARPLSALQVYIKYADHLFKEESFSVDKEEIQKRKKFFLSFQKIEQLLDEAKKDRNIEIDLKQAMVLEAKASLLKGKMLMGLGVYSDAIQNLNYSAKYAGWTNQNPLRFEILIARIHCYLLAGMYESARRLYPEMMQSIDSLNHEEFPRESLEKVLAAIKYDAEEITTSLIDAFIAIFENYEDKTYLATVIASRIINKIWHDDEKEYVKVFASLEPAINSANKASIFEILFNALFTEIVTSDEMDFIVSPYEELDVNLGWVTCIKDALQRVRAPFALLDRTDLFLPADLANLRIGYIQYLIESRNSVSNFLMDVLEDSPVLEIDEKEKVIEGLTSLLEREGILSKNRLTKVLDGIAFNTLPTAVKPLYYDVINMAISINIFSDSQQNGKYMRLLLDEYMDANNKRDMIDLMLSFSMQSDHGIYELAIVDQGKVGYVDEAERLLGECQSQIPPDDFINFRHNLGLCRCCQGDIAKGVEILFSAMEMCLETSDYGTCDTIYVHAEHFAKKEGNLPIYSKIKKLHKEMSHKMDEVERTFLDDHEDYVGAEVLAWNLQEVAMTKEQEDPDEALSLYNKAITLLERVPYGKKDQDYIYEKVGDIYRRTCDNEETNQEEFDHAYSEMIRCYERAYSINHELMDYDRMIELNKIKMSFFFDWDQNEEWHKTFLDTKELIFRNGNILEICGLFEDVVPDYDPEYDPNEDVEETEEDPSAVLTFLPAVELKQFYDELSQFLISKGLIDLQSRVKDAVVRYLLRMDEQELAETIRMET